MLLLDKAGRRVFLILGALLMAGSISGLGLIACLHPGQFQLISCAEDMEFMSVPSSYTSEKLSFNDTLPYNITSFVSSEPPETVNGYEPLFFHSRFSQFSFNISHENGSSEVVDVNEKSCPKNLQDFSNINKWSSLTFLLIYVASYSIGFGPGM